jgi:hypothetical protein
VAATLSGLGRPDVAAASTTAAAFAVIGISVLTAVRQIGVLTAVGMAVATVFFFVLYPALSFFWPRSFAAGLASGDTPRLERWAAAATRHAAAVSTAAALLAVGLLHAARSVQLDVALPHLRPAASEAVRVQDEIARRFGTTATSGAIVVRRASLDDALAAGEEMAHRLRAYERDGEVRAVQSIDAALPSPAAQRERLRRFNQLPRQRAAADLRAALARHGFLPARFEEFLRSLERRRDEEADVIRLGHPYLEPLASLLDHHVRRHGDEYIVATYVEPAPGVDLGAIASRLRRDLPGVAFAVAARSLLEAELAAELGEELLWFCVFGVAGNLLLLLLLFRHLGTAVAILAPVILVVLALFAVMAAAGIALDPVNLIVTPLVFGIGVDYGVYVAARARECGAVPPALRLAGRALVVSALTTIAGFGFLALSRYPFLASMGLLAAAGLALGLALSVVLLPALLALLGAPARRV